MSLNIQNNVSLKSYTTLQVGGPAEYFIDVDSEETLVQVVAHAQENELPITVLGEGSNVLVSSKGTAGIVAHMALKGIDEVAEGTSVALTAAAGELLDDVVLYAGTQGYWGLENLSHIPGTVGAAPVQNVGAYGVEVKDIIQSVRVYNTEIQQFEVLTAAECGFGYRDSFFKKPEGKKYIVVSVTFMLTISPTPQLSYKDLQNRFSESSPSLMDIRAAVIEIRATKFPNWKVVGTAGSFFKNPIIRSAKYEELCTTYPELPGFAVGPHEVKIPLGWILDKALHLRGEGNDKVGTYQGQALVLINKGIADSDDFIFFANDITQKVFDATGVSIDWEVTRVGV